MSWKTFLDSKGSTFRVKRLKRAIKKRLLSEEFFYFLLIILINNLIICWLNLAADVNRHKRFCLTSSLLEVAIGSHYQCHEFLSTAFRQAVGHESDYSKLDPPD